MPFSVLFRFRSNFFFHPTKEISCTSYTPSCDWSMAWHNADKHSSFPSTREGLAGLYWASSFCACYSFEGWDFWRILKKKLACGGGGLVEREGWLEAHGRCFSCWWQNGKNRMLSFWPFRLSEMETTSGAFACKKELFPDHLVSKDDHRQHLVSDDFSSTIGGLYLCMLSLCWNVSSSCHQKSSFVLVPNLHRASPFTCNNPDGHCELFWAFFSLSPSSLEFCAGVKFAYAECFGAVLLTIVWSFVFLWSFFLSTPRHQEKHPILCSCWHTTCLHLFVFPHQTFYFYWLPLQPLFFIRSHTFWRSQLMATEVPPTTHQMLISTLSVVNQSLTIVQWSPNPEQQWTNSEPLTSGQCHCPNQPAGLKMCVVPLGQKQIKEEYKWRNRHLNFFSKSDLQVIFNYLIEMDMREKMPDWNELKFISKDQPVISRCNLFDYIASWHIP